MHRNLQFEKNHPRIDWILRNASNDVNYRSTISELSDEELLYCLKCEKRVTGLKQLRREARRRSL